MCKCGRSPREDGKCVGFRKIEESIWNEQKDILIEEFLKNKDNTEEK